MPSSTTPAKPPKTFRQWLARRKDEPTPTGDLARDALADHNWKGQHTPDSLWRAMNRRTPCWGAIRAFKEARAEYEFDQWEAEQEAEEAEQERRRRVTAELDAMFALLDEEEQETPTLASLR